MKKPVLVIMAAGMGSRYGGLKQIDPVDEQGHIIMDFSLYDAKRAGFEKVVFIIKHENEEDFKKSIGNRMAQQMEVAYVFQELTNLQMCIRDRYGTLAKGPRYLEMAEGYVTGIALDEHDEIIGYKFVSLGKFTDFIKAGDTPNEAWEKAQGQYGRVDDAVKIIDPRQE